MYLFIGNKLKITDYCKYTLIIIYNNKFKNVECMGYP